MATTPEFGFRYPDGSDNVDIPTGIQELAFDVEDTLYNEYLSKAGGSLTGALTVPYGIDGGVRFGGSGPQVLAGSKSPYDPTNSSDLEDLAVGSLWIQTNWSYKSLGVDSTEYMPVVWIKKWPTNSYSNQWAVLSGDTGERDLSDGTLASFYGITLGSYMDITTPYSTLYMRRINNTIALKATGINFSTTRSGWEEILTYNSSNRWGVSGSEVYGTAFQESSSTMKPVRVKKSGSNTALEIYAPSGTATYSASVCFDANAWDWPDSYHSPSPLGYLGEDPSSSNF